MQHDQSCSWRLRRYCSPECAEEALKASTAFCALTPDVNVGGPDGRPPEFTVGTVTVGYYGDETRLYLYKRLEEVVDAYQKRFGPPAVTTVLLAEEDEP